jgi:hypothetical protein
VAAKANIPINATIFRETVFDSEESHVLGNVGTTTFSVDVDTSPVVMVVGATIVHVVVTATVHVVIYCGVFPHVPS